MQVKRVAVETGSSSVIVEDGKDKTFCQQVPRSP